MVIAGLSRPRRKPRGEPWAQKCSCFLVRSHDDPPPHIGDGKQNTSIVAHGRAGLSRGSAKCNRSFTPDPGNPIATTFWFEFRYKQASSHQMADRCYLELVPVLVRAQLCIDTRIIETAPGKPGIGAPGSPFDQLARLGEVIR